MKISVLIVRSIHNVEMILQRSEEVEKRGRRKTGREAGRVVR